ncbi:unnamed protein product [Mesocestoides corti]|uniref:Uncharacterized protein n=2 Tax=Mesocestoides corti TaxID=53468 RepID=A0A0R3UBI3_MESCO|nr:unnamed protein product [Mesocestoides corti]
MVVVCAALNHGDDKCQQNWVKTWHSSYASACWLTVNLTSVVEPHLRPLGLSHGKTRLRGQRPSWFPVAQAEINLTRSRHRAVLRFTPDRLLTPTLVPTRGPLASPHVSRFTYQLSHPPWHFRLPAGVCA